MVMPGPSKLVKSVTKQPFTTQGKFHHARRKQYDVTSITIKQSLRRVKCLKALLVCVRVPVSCAT